MKISLIIRFFSFLLFFLFLPGLLFGKVLVEGHRGSRMTHPENTLPAFKEALLAGAHILELDLALTKDKHLVVTHDPYINPVVCLSPEGKSFRGKRIIYHMSLAEIKKYDCGSLVNPRFPKQKTFPNTRIPTLKEVFELTKKYPKIEFNIETKIFADHPDITPTPEIFVKSILDIVKKYKLEERVIVQSFNYRTLKEVQKRNPKIRTSQLLKHKPKKDIVEMAQKLKVNIISPKHSWLTKKMVQGLQKKGIKVAPWTANTKKDWDRLIKMGVNSIITDSPRELIHHLKNYKPQD